MMTALVLAVLAIPAAVLNFGGRVAGIGHAPESEGRRAVEVLAGASGIAAASLMIASIVALMLA